MGLYVFAELSTGMSAFGGGMGNRKYLHIYSRCRKSRPVVSKPQEASDLIIAVEPAMEEETLYP